MHDKMEIIRSLMGMLSIVAGAALLAYAWDLWDTQRPRVAAPDMKLLAAHVPTIITSAERVKLPEWNADKIGSQFAGDNTGTWARRLTPADDRPYVSRPEPGWQHATAALPIITPRPAYRAPLRAVAVVSHALDSREAISWETLRAQLEAERSYDLVAA